MDGTVADVLKASSVLGALSAGARERLVAEGAAISLERGEFLCRVGDEADAAYVILSGELEIRTVDLEGRELRLASFSAASLVGEMAVLDGGARSADMAAARRTQLWRIPRSALLRMLQAEPTAALAIIAELSRRLRALNAAFEDMARLDLGGRLAVLLLAECNRSRFVGQSQTEIARRLGFSREKVNRKLHEWARDGWVEIRGGGVEIRSPKDLQALVRAKA